jgi:hypothetical protein
MPTFTVEVTDLEYRILDHVYGDPGAHIDRIVTTRAKNAIKELAEYEIKRRHEDPSWTKPIPADYETILSEMVIRSQKEMMEANSEYTINLVKDPDYGLTHQPPSAFYPKPGI